MTQTIKPAHPSKLSQMSLCPGSMKAQEGFPSQTSEAAESGNRVHDALRAVMEWANEGRENSLVTIVKHFGLSDRERRVYRFILHEVMSILSEHLGPTTYECEQPFSLTHNGTEIISGIRDFVVKCGDGTIHVVEYKTGRIEVEAADLNLQIAGYVVPIMLQKSDSPTEVFGHLIQASWDAEEKHSIVRYGIEDAENAYREILDIVAKANDDEALRIPGQKQCRFCQARGTAVCPESTDLVESLPDLIDQPVLRSPEIAPERVGDLMKVQTLLQASMSPERRSRVLRACLTADVISKKLKEEAKEILKEDAGAIPGFKLVDGSKTKSVDDIEPAFEMLQNIGFTGDEYQACLKFSLSRAVHILHSKMKADGMTQAGAKKMIETTLEELINVETNEPSLRYVGE